MNLDRLVGRIHDGDPGAETELVEHFTPRVRAMALARLRNPDLARDVTQETLIAVLGAARKGEIRDADRLSAYVLGVARNVINNGIRRRHRFPEVELDDVAQNLTITEDPSLRERRDALVRALRALNAPDRLLLRRTFVDGLKPAEIAERDGVTPEAVRTRKVRALKRVLEAFENLSRPASSYHVIKRTDSRT